MKIDREQNFGFSWNTSQVGLPNSENSTGKSKEKNHHWSNFSILFEVNMLNINIKWKPEPVIHQSAKEEGRWDKANKISWWLWSGCQGKEVLKRCGKYSNQ